MTLREGGSRFSLFPFGGVNPVALRGQLRFQTLSLLCIDANLLLQIVDDAPNRCAHFGRGRRQRRRPRIPGNRPGLVADTAWMIRGDNHDAAAVAVVWKSWRLAACCGRAPTTHGAPGGECHFRQR